MAQSLLFDPADLPLPIRYEKLLENLPHLQEMNNRKGRRPFSRNLLLKALIYKAFRRLVTLSDLVFELNNNSSLAYALGFDPMKPTPSVERFSAFLHDTHNRELQDIRIKLVKSLIESGLIKAKSIALDSCPIVAQVRENNLKTSMANRFDKTRKPAGDPEARLGVMIHYPKPFQKEVRYFWGYRNHTISDIDSELPIWEATKPANISEIRIARSLIREAKEQFALKIESVLADANYDAEHFLTYIIKDLQARAIIPHNPRNEQEKGYQIKRGRVLCEAGLPMYRKGKMRPKRTGILYCQYTCPIVYEPKHRRQYITCPIFHHKFFKGKGCNALIRLEPSIREQMDYGTREFKEQYKSRTSIERVFSRLLDIAMQNPTVRGFHATRNHATIAHIAALLIALTAYKMGFVDKIRFVKSFVPNLLK